MDQDQASGYWLDRVAKDIIKQNSSGEILVSSGISPSGPYHIGHFREVLTADAIAKSLKAHGRSAKHLHFIDDFDPLRRRYEFLPDSYEKWVGHPICLVPDPEDCHKSYADHWFAKFELSAKAMGVQMQVFSVYKDLYKTGKMADKIVQVFEHLDEIREILVRVAGRELPGDWTPVQKIGVDGLFENVVPLEWDPKKRTVGGLELDSGKLKLAWRLDWPARWALFGVQVEPYGKEHATKGGSFDTGKELAPAAFGAKAPYALPYDTINLLGQNKKMSSSLGNLVTPEQALEIMPPEILRYFVLRSRPERVLYFDSGAGLYNLIEEYSKVEAAVRAGEDHEFSEAYRMAAAGADKATISSVPFSHLVMSHQAALGDLGSMQEILERTGYGEAVKSQAEIIKREAVYVQNWLSKFAPDEVKFEVQKTLPKLKLTPEQKGFLGSLAADISAESNLSGQGMHDLIYAAREKAAIKPPEAFQAIYRAILGKDSGPKAGWFLASLERDFLVTRLKQAAS